MLIFCFQIFADFSINTQKNELLFDILSNKELLIVWEDHKKCNCVHFEFDNRISR